MFDIPTGWKKGENLVIGKLLIDSKPTWYVEQDRRYRTVSEVIELNPIAFRWFQNKEECFEFLAWWHEEM